MGHRIQINMEAADEVDSSLGCLATFPLSCMGRMDRRPSAIRREIVLKKASKTTVVDIFGFEPGGALKESEKPLHGTESGMKAIPTEIKGKI